MTADEALDRLREGNDRFVANVESARKRGAELRLTLVASQHPFAVVVGCSDSRVPPEILFDQGLGDLFVIRNAGNVVDATSLASVEYAVEHLDVSLVVVLGHERCGAVTAALDASRGQEVHGHLWSLIDSIAPALELVDETKDDALDQAVYAHVKVQTARLRRAQPIVARAVKSGQLRVVGARYDIDDGRVELVSPDEGS